jgi:hypothetical protein
MSRLRPSESGFRGHTVLVHRGCGHVNPQLPRFADNVWCAPGQIGLLHWTDEIADVYGNRRTPGHATLTHAPPIQSLEQERFLTQGCWREGKMSRIATGSNFREGQDPVITRLRHSLSGDAGRVHGLR